MINDNEALTTEVNLFVELPQIRSVTVNEINRVYRQIKADVRKIVDDVFEMIMSDPGMENL